MRTEVLRWKGVYNTGQLASNHLLIPSLPSPAVLYETGTGTVDISPLPAGTVSGFASKGHWRDKAKRKGLVLLVVFLLVLTVQHPSSGEFAGTSTSGFLL